MSEKNVNLGNLGTRSRLDEVLESIKGFWHWWLDELAGLTPPALRSQFKTQSKTLLVEIDNGACRLKTKTANGLELLTEFDLDSSPSVEEVERRRQLAGMADQITLLLPSHLILRKTISLPVAAQNKLMAVLQFEMDRNTPFKAEDVYFSYQVIGRDSTQQKIQVGLSIVTRVVLDELLTSLAKQGIKPASVVPADLSLADIDNPELNLLLQSRAPGQRDKAPRQRQKKFWILLILVILIALGGLYQRYQRVEELTQEIEEPRALAMQAKKMRQELQQLKESQYFLVNKKVAAPSTLILLNELTRMLPDNTWINRLNVKDGAITLQGESTNASALIALIDASEMFKDVSFSSPVTINPRTQKERFSLSAQLKEPRELRESRQGGAE